MFNRVEMHTERSAPLRIRVFQASKYKCIDNNKAQLLTFLHLPYLRRFVFVLVVPYNFTAIPYDDFPILPTRDKVIGTTPIAMISSAETSKDDQY